MGNKIPISKLGTCELCHTTGTEVSLIYKQIHGGFKRLYVCSKCSEEHERELEMTRQNFRAQFGDR